MGVAMRFADPVAVVVAWLDDYDTSVPVSGRVPTDRPETFVRVMLTGSTMTDLAMRECRLAVDCWAPTDAQAADLGARVQSWLCELDDVDGWVPEGPDGWVDAGHASHDPDTGEAIWSMTVVLAQAPIQEDQ